MISHDETTQSELKLFLAPMEGVTDWAMRDLLTAVGGIDYCVTEFLRVTDNLHSDEVFHKNCPELLTGSRTRSGVPVFVQLLGGKVEPLAANAAKAAELGAYGVDLNFGCPAKTVNRHDGGATLLQYPDRIYAIVSAVRRAVPSHIPVTAKIRLGFENTENCLANAQAIEAAGAAWLTVHCRTKTDGYKPPAYWEWIPKIREASAVRLVTNGEIWNISDFRNVRKVAGTLDYMIGRGALRDPFLFKKIKADDSTQSHYDEIKTLLPSFYRASSSYRNPAFAVARTKGWLKQLAFTAPEFESLFENLKVITQPQPFQERLESL